MDPNQNAFKSDSYEQTKFLLGRDLVVTVTDKQLSPHVRILFGYEPLSQLYVNKYLLLNGFHSSFILVLEIKASGLILELEIWRYSVFGF